MFGEGIAEFDVLAGRSPVNGMKGLLPKKKKRALLHTTIGPFVRLSPDGGRLLDRQNRRLGQPATRRWSIIHGGGRCGGIADFWRRCRQHGILERLGDARHARADRAGLGDSRWSTLARTRTERRSSMPDSAADDFTPLPGGGLGVALLPAADRSSYKPTVAARRSKRFRCPPWYMNSFGLGASRDGSKLAIVGWSTAQQATPIGLSVVSATDGTEETRWATVFGEDGCLSSGSRMDPLMLFIEATNDTYALQHVRAQGQIDQIGAIPQPIVGVSVSERPAADVGSPRATGMATPGKCAS